MNMNDMGFPAQSYEEIRPCSSEVDWCPLSSPLYGSTKTHHFFMGSKVFCLKVVRGLTTPPSDGILDDIGLILTPTGRPARRRIPQGGLLLHSPEPSSHIVEGW